MRWTCVMLMLMLAGAWGAGCQSAPRAHSEAELRVLRQRAWVEAKAYERQRLAGWDAADGRNPLGLLDDLVELPGRLIDVMRGHTPEANVRKVLDSTSADARREGLFYLGDREFARTKEPYLVMYRGIAVSDPDPTVRAAAVRVLNRARDKAAVPVFLKTLEDPNDWVRLEAAKALANVPDESAVGPLIAHLRNAGEMKDVRLAAADALRLFPRSDVAQALIAALPERDFGVAWQARRSLWVMTARDFGYDQREWLGYITTAERPFA